MDDSRLTLLKLWVKKGGYSLYSCSCGNTTIARNRAVRVGSTKICGCLKKEKGRFTTKRNTTRNMIGISNVCSHPLYAIWAMIKQRCYNVKYTSYASYGGRGIVMCDRWRDSFENFVNDIGERPSKQHTIDRFPDRDGNYEPSNVRWATWHEQNLNRRPRGSVKKDLENLNKAYNRGDAKSLPYFKTEKH